MSSTFPGQNPRGYIGLKETNPPNITFHDRDPRTSDFRNFDIGDIWYNKSTAKFFILEAKTASSGTWESLANPFSFPVTVSEGGTGRTSFTPYEVVAGGTTLTGPLQQVGSVGTTGDVLTSQGANMLPIWATPTSAANPSAFYAYLSANQINATGDGTPFIVPYNTTLYNVGGGFNTGTNRYTAADGGPHRFITALELANLSATHTRFQLELVVTGAGFPNTYLLAQGSPAEFMDSTDRVVINASCDANMAIGDQAQLRITVFNSSLTVTVGGGTPAANGFFSGSFLTSFAFAGIFWQNIALNQTLAVNQGYFVTGGALTLTMPATSVVGDVIHVVLRGGTSFDIRTVAGQTIRINTLATSAFPVGSVFSNRDGTSIRFVCQAANTEWVAVSEMGSLVVT